LKKQLRDMVGFVIPDITGSMFGSILTHAEDLAYQDKLGMLAYSTGDDLGRQQMYLDLLQSEHVAGILVVPAPGTDPETLMSIQAQGIPIVLLDRKLEGFVGDYVTSNNFQGAYDGVNHLLDLGYRNIATIAGSQHISSGMERLKGYKQALLDANIPIREEWIRFGNFDRDISYNVVKEFVKSDNRPDAIFVANDLMMVGALHALHDLNVKVPEELAIVAFDELPLSAVLNPPLTTISQSTVDLAQESFRLLRERLEQPDRVERFVQIPTQLNIRESCGTPREHHPK